MPKPRAWGTARERLLAAAYQLFRARGIAAVGIGAIIARADVARMTFYRCFRSKDDLVLAFLRERERRWTVEWLEGGVMRRTKQPRQRLLAIFDLFDEWFRQPEYEGCSFMKVLFEDGPRGAFGKSATRYRANVRRLVERLASQAGIADVAQFSVAWHMLMEGSIVAAFAGDKDAARAAKKAGLALMSSFRGAARRGAG